MSQDPLSSEAPDGTRRRRPRAVTFVAWLSIIQGSVALTVGGLVLVAIVLEPASLQLSDVVPAEALGVMLGFSGGAVLLAAIGLLRLRPWAWTLAMATQCWTLTLALYDYLAGNPEYAVMALGVLTVLLLNQQEVRVAFEASERRRD